MYPLYDTFHRLTVPESPTFLFARLLPDALQILKDEVAFVGLPSDKKVLGASGPVSDSLLSVLLTSPLTRARLEERASSTGISASNQCHTSIFHLEHTDAHSLTLKLSLPVSRTPASPILSDLHSSLLTAVAALEGALLASNSDDGNVQVVADLMASHYRAMSLTTLTTLHAPPKPTGEPLSKIPSFRRVAAADDAFIAARGFAVATQAAAVRKDVILRRQIRLDEERRRRKYERNVAREAVHRKSRVSEVVTGAAALFDDNSSEGSPEPAKNIASGIDGSRSTSNNNVTEANPAREHEHIQSNDDNQDKNSDEQRGGNEKNLAVPQASDVDDDIARERNELPKKSAGEHPQRSADEDVGVGSQNDPIKQQDDQVPRTVKPKKKKRKVARLV